MEPNASRESASSARPVLLGLAVALVVFAGYLPTVAPGITTGDSGEFVAASYTLGIPHPPGYPLWCLLSRAFAEVVPAGSFARRVNLSSAFFAALAAGGCAALGVRLGAGAVPALAGGLAVGFARALWSQSVIAEIYALNALLFVLGLWTALGARARGGLARFGFVAGLSLTMHPIMRGLVPLLAVYALYERRADLRRPRVVAGGLGAFLLGLSVLLYLPIRAAADPYLNWENPKDLRGILRLVGMAAYRNPEENVLLRVPIYLGFGERLVEFGKIFLLQYPPWHLPVAGIGAVALVRRRPAFGALVALLFLASSVGIVAYTAREEARLYPPAYQTFSIPAFLVAGIWLAVGFGAMVRFARARLGGFPLALRGAALAILVVYFLAAPAHAYALHRRKNDRSSDALALDYGRNLLDTVEPGGLFLAWGDLALIPCVYLQAVEGFRSDVEMPTRSGRVDPALFAGTPPPPSAVEWTEGERLARALAATRPFYTNVLDRYGPASNLKFVPVGLLYRVVREGSPEEKAAAERDAEAWARYRWRTLGTERGEFIARELEATVRERAAAHFSGKGDPLRAAREWIELAAVRPKDSVSLANAGVALANAGRPREGIEYLRRSLALAPDDPETRGALGGLLAGEGSHAEAVETLRPLLAATLEQIEPFLALAGSARALGDPFLALEALRVAREQFPSDARPFALAALVLLEDRRDARAAIPLAEGALARDPGSREYRALLARARAEAR